MLVFVKEVGPKELLSRCQGGGGGGGGSFRLSASQERCAPCVRDPVCPWLVGVQGEAGSSPEGGGPRDACLEDAGGRALFQEPPGTLYQARGKAMSALAREPGCGAASPCPAPCPVSRCSCCR